MSGKKQPLNGERASRPTKPRSKSKPDPRRRRLERLLGAAFDQFQTMDGRKLQAACRRDFIFHMTDWSGDLQHLAELYKHPDKFGKESAAQVVAGFLYHVIPHLRAAGHLMLDYTPEDFFRKSEAKV